MDGQRKNRNQCLEKNPIEEWLIHQTNWSCREECRYSRTQRWLVWEEEKCKTCWKPRSCTRHQYFGTIYYIEEYRRIYSQFNHRSEWILSIHIGLKLLLNSTLWMILYAWKIGLLLIGNKGCDVLVQNEQLLAQYAVLLLYVMNRE